MTQKKTNEPKSNNVVKGIINDVINSSLFLTFFVSSILMMNVAGFFHLPGIVEHPQFSEMADAAFIKNSVFEDGWLYFSYYLFFVLDFIWAFCLLLLIWKFVKKKFPVGKNKRRKILFGIFTVLVILAYMFDVMENLHYMITVTYSAFFTKAKMLFYILVAIVFLISLLRYLYAEFLPTLQQFLISSVISLFILIIIGILLPTAPQVNSIVVDLYLNPWNMIILLLVAPVFAVAIAHYPSYFGIEEENREWLMAKLKFWILGVVHYRYKKNYSQASLGQTEGRINFLFRLLGICFYAALFYMIAYTAEVNFSWYIKASTMAISLLACGVFVLHILKVQKDNWFEKNYKYLFDNLPTFYDGDYTSESAKKDFKIIESLRKKKESNSAETQIADDKQTKEAFSVNRGPIKIYLWLFLITIVLHLVLFTYIIACPQCAYSEVSTIISLGCIVLQCITFVYYRSYRSLFRFVFYKKGNNAILNSFLKYPYGEDRKEHSKDKLHLLIEKLKGKIYNFFTDNKLTEPKGLFRVGANLGFGSLSNNVTFLQLNTGFGFVNVLFFLVVNFWSAAAVSFNGILIILSALFLFYGILVGLTKNFIYYKYSEEEHREKNKLKFIYTILIGFVLIIGLNSMSRMWNNNLFTLTPIERNEDAELTLEQFNKGLDSISTRYYVGCYGGGMKSNAWTMTVLNKLNDVANGDFYKRTVGISGVSGGTMGLANISAIMSENGNDSIWPSMIEKVATENILSLDLTHALGRDTFSHLLIPKYTLSGYDRSSKAMERYALLTNNMDAIASKKAYRVYWREIYDSLPGSFPILIANSTNVKGNQGMAVSVRVEDSTANELLYHEATNILEIENGKKTKQTLTYYDAMSTSNRFPLISPAVKIETKGHFNDGGIYENSGLLSAFKLFEAVNQIEKVNNLKQLKQKNVFLSIVNSKDSYIKEVLKKYKCEPIKINENTEINAIISSIADTEMMPIYIKKKLERLKVNYPDKIGFETIYLPHRFSVADVKRILGKELLCKSNSKVAPLLYSIVKKNNDSIEALLKQQKVETLLKEQELVSLDAMIAGQEKERTKVANELHDDLGSLMATVKLHFDNVKVDEKDRAMKSAQDLLEKAYQKIRGMAHAKNSGVMANQGLLPAVQKMARTINETKSLEVTVEDFGLADRMENSLELTIFRILQELVANIIKHAQATKASIQFTQHEDKLNIIVEDNGNGFDMSAAKRTSSSMGLGTIEKRIEHLEGSFTVDSVLGKGTSILIDIPI